LEKLQKYNNCYNNNLNQKQLWISNNNPKLKDYKEKINSDINVYSTTKLADITANPMIDCMGGIDFKEKKEGKFFMCHNRRARSHRYGLLILLKKYNLIKDVDWSLINGWQMKNINYRDFYSNIFNESDMKILLPEIYYFNSIKIKKSDFEKKYNWFKDPEKDNINWNNTYDRKTFEESYFNITTESEYDSDIIHITEKSFKAFYTFQFPLILASPNHIKEIKKTYNFDFFDDIIDHSYDNITNHKDFFIDFYSKNKDRFLENNRKIIEKGKNITDLEFLIKLSGIDKYKKE
jgi:hypothetical protein